MRTFRLALAGSVAVLFCALGSAMAADVAFRSPEDAMKQGISAFNGGYYELALAGVRSAGSRETADRALL